MGAAMRAGLLHSQPAGTPLMDLLLTLLLDMTGGIQYLHDKSIIHGGEGRGGDGRRLSRLPRRWAGDGELSVPPSSTTRPSLPLERVQTSSRRT